MRSGGLSGITKGNVDITEATEIVKRETTTYVTPLAYLILEKTGEHLPAIINAV